jgi:hypothetical protein
MIEGVTGPMSECTMREGAGEVLDTDIDNIHVA